MIKSQNISRQLLETRSDLLEARDVIESMLSFHRPGEMSAPTEMRANQRIVQKGGLVEYLKAALANIELAAASLEITAPSVLHLVTMRRHDVEDGSQDPVPNEPVFDLKVTGSPGQIIVAVSQRAEGITTGAPLPGLLLGIEIDHGLPCVHIHGNGEDDRLQASVFGLNTGGIAIRRGNGGAIQGKIIPDGMTADLILENTYQRSAPTQTSRSKP